ncbi:ATP-dependent helicase [Peredibacter starrii]|uniref:DNA 3'-5' helicase n=1 Tax=Peredibacter starrii TaxID=28202 RepID=A0AAX4HQT4_9BACT|nr:UvrD-helicase domain-containing protein [Peredibacter starrii]WPU65606.1 3'-5' exonuclease [Peredibacter starrii]
MNLDFLNESQRQAVLMTDGPVMILAGAGSGKTRTLVARIQYLLEEKRVSPYQILAVTFSNKAAREMRERLAVNTSVNVGTLQVTTFHAFCAKVLRMEATYLGLSKNFTIYDDGESQSIIKAILTKRGINQKELSPYTVAAFIDGLKNLGYYMGLARNADVEKYAEDKRLFDIFMEYEAELHRSNAVDFGGLITGVLNLFRSYPEVLQKYQQKFKYVLVDEYQDTNRAQFDLILQLSQTHRNLCVVGDEDQSIYSWRGADIRNILDYESVFPEAKLIKLEQNYRSSKKIIEAASEVISRNLARKGKQMWTDNDEGEEIRIVECRDDKAEADFVGQQIRHLVQEGVSLKDIAVFYRNNAHSRTIEDALRKEKFPYRVVAGIKFYDRKEIKDMISYMRVVVNKKDSLALTRIINTPARGVGATSLRKLEDEAVRLQLSLFELLEKIVESPAEFKHLSLSGKVQSAVYQLVHLIQEVQVLETQNHSPSFSYEKLLNESGYYEVLRADKSYEGAARLENLEELMSAIKQFEDSENEPNMVKFLETITLDTTVSEDGSTDQVSLMTVHGSKGLEYPYVFLIGIEENIFPSYKSLEVGPVALEEERRLFYVAMTRAMKQLTITFAQSRLLWGSIKFNGPSQFLHEIPAQYYRWDFFQTGSKKAQFDNYSQSYDDWDQSNHSSDDQVFYKEKVYQTKKAVANLSNYPSGSKIVHALYGEGTVLDTEGLGQDEKVTILFRDGVRKKFMVKFAPLQKA